MSEAVVLPALVAPGETDGPCVLGCEHLDCVKAKLVATDPCVWCAGTIGYGRPWVDLTDRSPQHGYERRPWRLAHAVCHELNEE